MPGQAAVPQARLHPTLNHRRDACAWPIRELLANSPEPLTAWDLFLQVDANLSCVNRALQRMRTTGEVEWTTRPARGPDGQPVGGPSPRQYQLRQ